MADESAKFMTIQKIAAGDNAAGFPKEVLAPIWKRAFEGSLVQQIAGTTPVSLAGNAMPYPTGRPVAGIVGEAGEKPVTEVSVGIKTFTPKKAAAIVVLSKEALMANPLGAFDDLQQQLSQAIADTIDTAVLFGKDTKTGTALTGVESVNDTPHVVTLDPAQEVEAVVAASREAYRQRGLSITVEPLPTGCQVLADPIYFHSILTNLLDNSAKYKDKATGQVTITGAVEGQDFCLTVDDDGPGVPPEALPRLFDVFYRNDPARKNPDQGSGLGLAIVAKSMERMGGTIRAENRPQGGLRMVLRIPQTEGEMDHETHSDR